jgi:hypothetical protein
MRKTIIAAGALVLMMASVPAATAAPADGNGNKEVLDLDFSLPITCDNGTELGLHVGGWLQIMEFGGNGNKNIDHATVHVEFEYTNADGGTFAYLDVGTDRLSVDKDGNLVFQIIGRVSDAFGLGFSINGQVVLVNFNLDSTSGNLGPSADEQACNALS